LALALIIVVLSLIAQTIVGSLQTALMLIIGAFFAAGLFYILLSLLIWLVGRFLPTFGVIDVKIPLRQMLAGRSRAAVTLLALVIGVFSLSTITLMADSITNLLRISLNEQSGGNVNISVAAPMLLGGVENVLDSAEGINGYQTVLSHDMTLVTVEDNETGEVLTLEQLAQRLDLSSFTIMADDEAMEELNSPEFRQDMVSSLISRVDERSLDSLPERDFVAGRQLTPEDIGQPVMIMGDQPSLRSLGLSVGDRLTFEVMGGGVLGIGAQTEEVTFEIVGLTRQGALSGGFFSENYAPEGAFPEGVAPTGVNMVADVDEDAIPALRRELADMMGVFVIETSLLTNLIQTLLGTFTAFPTMVAALGLIVGGVVIANSVALTTMERRREIAVMKSVGLQRERVLMMILTENGILGLIGGLLGVGIGLIALVLLVSQIGAPPSALPIGTALLLMALCVAVALIAALTTAWGASGEKPLNVLRYE
jgi:hypothetical protein